MKNLVTKEEIFIVTLVFLCFKTLDTRSTCPPEQYYDSVVGRCTPCADICRNAAIQRTERECARQCPDYEIPDKTTGTVKYFLEPKITTGVAVAIALGALIITIIGAMIIAIWKRKKIKHFICKLMGRTDGDDANREETTSMRPPSDDNIIAQVYEDKPSTYRATTSVT